MWGIEENFKKWYVVILRERKIYGIYIVENL